MRCLKDHGHDQTMLSVKEISNLMTQINAVLLNRYGNEATEYAGFVQVVI